MYKDDLWRQSEAFVKPPKSKNLEKFTKAGNFFDEDNEELEISINNDDYKVKKNERSLILTENDSEDEEKIAII